MKEKAIVSSLTLVTSLSGYFYAKSAEKDVVPYMMISGFWGALIGEVVAHALNKEEDSKENNKSKNKK